jgi:uncharacterized protein (DUF1778 family)
MATPATKTQARAVNIRIPDDMRNLIDRAARTSGKSRSDFMIEAAKRAAEETLLDQTLIMVKPGSFAWYLDVVDQPPSGPGYDKLMAANFPWKR